MIGYLEVQETKSITDIDGAISCIVDLHCGKDPIVDDRLTRLGITENGSGKQRYILEKLTRYESISFKIDKQESESSIFNGE